MERDNTLAGLLNNESFIRWLKGEATDDEKDRWDEWVKEEQNAQELVRKAHEIYIHAFSGRKAC